MSENKKSGLAGLLTSDRWSDLTVSVLAIVLMLITSSIILLMMGKNPLVAFRSFLQGCGWLPKANYGGGSGMLSDFFDYLNILAPMLLAALSAHSGRLHQRPFSLAREAAGPPDRYSSGRPAGGVHRIPEVPLQHPRGGLHDHGELYHQLYHRLFHQYPVR